MSRAAALGALVALSVVLGIAVGYMLLVVWPVVVDFVLVAGFFAALVAGAS